MRLFFADPFGKRRQELTIRAGSLLLRPPEAGDFEEWAALRATSRAFLEPWEPTWPADDLTPGAFRLRLRRYRAEIEDDEAYPYFLFQSHPPMLVGGLTLGNVRRGAANAATLGYWMGAPHARRGHMTKAVASACRFAFVSLGLERIEAACLPENAASIRLLTKVGFRQEGLARQYLSINGRRRDHLLFALIEREQAGADTRC